MRKEVYYVSTSSRFIYSFYLHRMLMSMCMFKLSTRTRGNIMKTLYDYTQTRQTQLKYAVVFFTLRSAPAGSHWGLRRLHPHKLP